MSYNITAWRTRSMVDFTIPLDIVRELPYAKVKLLPEDKVSVSGVSEGFELKGTLLDRNILVGKIHHRGESSGYTWDVLLEALKYSRGRLVATQVWDGGDSATKLSVKDGAVRVVQVEL